MKYNLRNTYLIGLTALAVVCSLESCKEETKVDPVEKAKQTLTSSDWDLLSAELDGVDYTDLYDGLQLKFSTDNSYEVVNFAAPVWNESGTYALMSITELKLDGIREVTIEELTSASLVLKFQFEGSGGRMKSVGGEYIFEFAAQ